jgi:hypothetical protein
MTRKLRLADARTESQSYHALWSAVVLRAIYDVRGEHMLPEDDADDERRAGLATEAHHWLTGGPGQVICEALGIPAEKVRETLASV